MNLCRAKKLCPQDDAWVTGYPVSCSTDDNAVCDRIYTGYDVYRVRSDTVSHLIHQDNSDNTRTGLGLTIYEGDIIRVGTDYDSLDGFSRTSYGNYLCEYSDRLKAYVFYYIDPNDGVQRDGDIWYWSDIIEDLSDISVIGNKWDTPKMLSATESEDI